MRLFRITGYSVPLIGQAAVCLRKILPAGEQKQRDCQSGGEIVRDGLRRREHGCGVENAVEQKQHRQVNNALAADGKDQGRQRGAGGLDRVDEYEQQSHDGSGVNINAGERHAVGKSVRIFEKRMYQRTGAAVADDRHNGAQ